MTLSLWRLILGIAVLASLGLVLFSLGPIYLDDYRLKGYINSVATSAAAASMPDEAVRTTVTKRANQLDLPVQEGDVLVTHPGGKIAVDVKYVVAVNFPLYNVDLHFHTAAAGR